MQKLFECLLTLISSCQIVFFFNVQAENKPGSFFRTDFQPAGDLRVPAFNAGLKTGYVL
jgi:hypothetical protein